MSEEKVKYNHDEIINSCSSIEFDARVEEIMAKIYEQDCWLTEEYEMIRMFIYTKLAPRKWEKEKVDRHNRIDKLEKIESI